MNAGTFDFWLLCIEEGEMVSPAGERRIFRPAGRPTLPMSARRYKLHIPRPDLAVRSRSFRCTFSPNRTRCAGLRFGTARGQRDCFALWASSFCSGAKGTKRPPGDGVWKNTPCFYAASPGPPDMFTGEPPRRWKKSNRRGKSPGLVSVRQPLPLRGD